MRSLDLWKVESKGDESERQEWGRGLKSPYRKDQGDKHWVQNTPFSRLEAC